MKKIRPVTKSKLTNCIVSGLILMLLGPFLSVWTAIYIWTNLETGQVTNFEQITAFIVLPICAIVLFVNGLDIVIKSYKRLRSGDYENNSHSSAQS